MSDTPRSPNEPGRLYSALPAFIRQHDSSLGLAALLRVLEEPLVAVEEDAAGLYDNWFIETCEDWVIPYLADLLGLEGLPVAGESPRAYVANTLARRRRKGTPAALAGLGWDLAGWPALCVELERRVLATPHMHSSSRSRIANLRSLDSLTRTDGPFDGLTRTVDLRPLHPRIPRAQLRHVGLFVWRTRAFRLLAAPAVESGSGLGRFVLHPRGFATPLFSPARPGLLSPREHEVPGPLRPAALAAELTRRRADPAAERLYFGELPVLVVRVRERSVGGTESLRPLRPEELLITDLGLISGSEWTAPVAAEWTSGQAKAAVDPQLGRVLLNRAFLPQAVAVETSFFHGAAGEVGAGAYERPAPGGEVATVTAATPALLSAAAISSRLAARPPERRSEDLVFSLGDSGGYTLPTEIQLDARAALAVGVKDGHLPLVRPSGALTVRGPGRLVLEGLSLPADLAITVIGSGVEIELRQCTFEALGVSGPAVLRLDRCLGLRCTAPDGRVDLQDSVLHGSPRQLVLSAATLRIERSTILGQTRAQVLELCSDSLLTGRCTVERGSIGGVRFSFLPQSSTAPARYRCISAAAGATADDLPLDELKQIFDSDQRGQPGYLVLRLDAPAALRTGASDGGELGVWNHLKGRQREDALRGGLDEYTRAGYTAAIYFVT